MDIRNEIVDTIMLKMQNIIDELAMERLQTVLLDKLDKYEMRIYGQHRYMSTWIKEM